jgi:phage terminase large subunit-like protein
VTATLEDVRTGAWRQWSPERKRAALMHALGVKAKRTQQAREPYPWQRPHDHPPERTPGACTPECNQLPPMAPLGPLDMWLMMGGRGTGKTDAGSMYVLDHVNGPACDPKVKGGHRIAIVAPTLGDAVESCVNGPSGLKAYDPRVRVVSSTGGTFVVFANGSRAKLFGANTENDTDRLRAGGNRCLVWLEEAAAMRFLGKVLEQSELGLRLGPAAHYVATTTPRGRPEVRRWQHDPHVHITRGRTRDAHHLAAQWRERLERRLQGTRMGRQELDGVVLDDVEGALWTQAQIDAARLRDEAGRPTPIAPLMRRIVVAVDPNGGGKDEVGIIVVGLGDEQALDSNGRMADQLYVLEDCSGSFDGPGHWAARVIQAYRRWQANAVVAEVNYGGDMVVSTIHTADPTVPCRVVRATRGKALRAEPVQALYAQERVHHVGIFPELEEQQTTWTEDAGTSPDRMDALVWGATDLAVLDDAGAAGNFVIG